MTRLASLSVDLDNHWSYLKTHGGDSWRDFPTYLDTVVPLLERFADDHQLGLTVFVVGQDADLEANESAMAQLGEGRHEVANHSYHHEPWMHLKTDREVRDEISRSHEAIQLATGKTPIGFRGPGFSISQATMKALVERDYMYDASTLPTFIGPLARAFYMRSSQLDSADLERREKLFGTVRDVFRPIKPYRWDCGLLEMPVTTMPFFRVPIHATYLLYLARWSKTISFSYLKAAMRLCRAAKVEPSILLHSLDFIGGDDVSDLAFFPGMDMTGAEKRTLLSGYVSIMRRHFEVVSMAEHAVSVANTDLRTQEVSSLA